LQLQELAPCHALDVLEPGHHPAAEQRLGVKAGERVDHAGMMFCDTESVNRFQSP
jgi:hypothetical protein